VKNGICPKCASRDILAVEVTDQVVDRLVGLAQVAHVCGACGLIEFYARDIDEVRRVVGSARPVDPGPYR
jgi:hypothetical protein